MPQISRVSVAVLAVLFLGVMSCDAPTSTAPEVRDVPRLSSDADTDSDSDSDDDDDSDVTHVARGEGRYLIANAFDSKFDFVARQFANGRVAGTFRESLLLDGLTVDFEGKVICLAFDLTNRRAWIGAVITRNRSTHPSFQQAVHQPGEDVWFRVVDYGRNGEPQPDRRTFLGFENTPGIPTSQIYCDLRIWPDGDARTWPVTKGDIAVIQGEDDD